MSYKNNSENRPYYTQRNNKYKPGETCNVTSMVSALSAAGYPVEQMLPDGIQPEDSLYRFIMTDNACANMWRRLDPKGNIPPNEWHDVLAYGTSRWLIAHGIKCASIHFVKARESDIRALIDKGGAAVVSGVFETQNGKINHIVSIVGYNSEGFIIDDPWGDFRDKYDTQNGNDIPLTSSQFIEMIKPLGKMIKNAHMIAPYSGKKKAEDI